MTSKREDKTTAGDPGTARKRKASSPGNPQVKKAHKAAPAPVPAPTHPPAPAQSSPAAEEQAQELTPGQRLYRDELLGRLQAIKQQKAAFKAEKRAIREQIGALEQRIEGLDSALKGCQEEYMLVVSKLKSI